MAATLLQQIVPHFNNETVYEHSSADPARTLEVRNPATDAVITTIRVGDATTANAAVERSHAAQLQWRDVSPMQRSSLLFKTADALEEHADEIAVIESIENGKPRQDARAFDCAALTTLFRYFGSLVDKLPTPMHDMGNMYAAEFREPRGVCVGILPFNWPPAHVGGKLAPSLAAGNTMILKPGEQAPLTVMRIVEIIQTVLPKDVVQAVPGNGPEVPTALIEHPLVRGVSFTGSTSTGKLVAQAGAKTIKYVALELGGKNAMVVFEDADIDAAVRDAMSGALYNKGEACTALSRMLVHESVHDEFVKRLSAAWKLVRSGDGADPTTHVGPVVSRAQQERVQSYMDVARTEGAHIAAQAPLPSDPKLSKGYFIPPTLYTNVSPTSRMFQEEMFGPLATVTPFKTEAEAIELVNASSYGLTCSIFSASQTRAWRVARAVEAGRVYLNNYDRAGIGLPFGGVKDSGNTREHCIETLREYTVAKVVKFPSGRGDPVPTWQGVDECFGKAG